MIDNRAVGRRVAALRQEHSLTQQQLAAMLRVSHQAVSKWESGQALPDIQTMLELTQFFGVTVEQLLSGDAQPEAANEMEASCAQAQQERQEAAEADAGAEPGEEQYMNIQQLLQMAPFMSKEGVEEIAMRLEGPVTASQLARLAPFVHPECVEALMKKYQPQMSWEDLRKLAPFMGREAVDKLARSIANGEATVRDPAEGINKTINDIGKAFDDIGKGVGQAFDGLGKGMEKVVRKAWRFGENVVNEVSNAINDISTEAQQDAAPAGKVRSKQAQAIRKRAFERAIEDGKWDWLAAHMDEISGDAEMKARIAGRARALGMHEWICQHLEGYADAVTVEAAISGGNWDWLQENICEMDAELQERAVRAAMAAANWEWLQENVDGMQLENCAPELARAALEAGEDRLAAQIAAQHLSESQVAELANLAYAGEDFEALEMLLPSCGEVFADALLRDLASQGNWARVEAYVRYAGVETVEQLMELAVEQGDFEAVDMLDQHL